MKSSDLNFLNRYSGCLWSSSYKQVLECRNSYKRVNFLFIYLIYLFLAALGLRCCAQAFSSCGEQGLLFVAVHGLLIAVASLVARHGL